MDDTSTAELLPRKRLKTNHTDAIPSLNNNIPESAQVNGAHAMSPQDTSPALVEQLKKEKRCGIQEFVTPHLLGFSGVLKKR